MTAETTRAIAYIRSIPPTGSATGPKNEIETQQIRAYCQLAGITLVDMFKEETGAWRLPLLRRPALQAALFALKCGRADVMIVRSLLTLSRSMAELGPWLAAHFGRAGLPDLIALQEHIDTRQPLGRAALDVAWAMSLVQGVHHA